MSQKAGAGWLPPAALREKRMSQYILHDKESIRKASETAGGPP